MPENIHQRIRSQALSDLRGGTEPQAKGHISSMADSVGKFLATVRLDQRMGEARIRQDWPKIVGEFNARHTNPQTLVNKILTVSVANSILRYELERQKVALVSKINTYLGSESVKKIVLRIG